MYQQIAGSNIVSNSRIESSRIMMDHYNKIEAAKHGYRLPVNH